jgi:hypothetical protein
MAGGLVVGGFERTRKEVVAAYFKPGHYSGGTEENYGKSRMR